MFLIRHNSYGSHLSVYNICHLLSIVVAICLVIVGLFWVARRGEPSGAESAESGPVSVQNQAPVDPYESMLRPLIGQFNEAFDERYINLMLTHQAIATSMAKLVADSNEPKIKELSKAILDEQVDGSESLRQWATAWGYTVEEPDKEKLAKVVEGIRNKTGIEQDQQFASEILDHAGGSVAMARYAVVNSERNEVKAMADSIIKKQTTLFTDFEAWAQSKGMLNEDGSADAHSQHDTY